MSFTRKILNRASATTGALALALNFAAFSANAADSAETESLLNQVFQAQVNSYYSVNGFYNYSANQGSQKDLTIINESLEKLGELANAINNRVESGSVRESFDTVNTAWKSYKKVLEVNIDEVKNTGYPDLRLAGDMANENIKLNASLSALYGELINTSTKKPNKVTELSRKTATTLALMMTKYSARTTSTTSQVYAGGDGTVANEVTIDALAKEFSAQLTELITLTENNAKAAKLLDSANTKWDFIKSSYVNYNENRVNFIVNLYSKKIISDIDLALATN